MVEEALAVAGVVVGVEDVEEEVVDLEVEADDMTMRKKLFYYLIHIVLTLYEKISIHDLRIFFLHARLNISIIKQNVATIVIKHCDMSKRGFKR